MPVATDVRNAPPRRVVRPALLMPSPGRSAGTADASGAGCGHSERSLGMNGLRSGSRKASRAGQASQCCSPERGNEA